MVKVPSKNFGKKWLFFDRVVNVLNKAFALSCINVNIRMAFTVFSVIEIA